jgi:hypothetical protein
LVLDLEDELHCLTANLTGITKTLASKNDQREVSYAPQLCLKVVNLILPLSVSLAHAQTTCLLSLLATY